MTNFPENLRIKLEVRQQNHALRALSPQSDKIDFASNDYLGFAQSKSIFDEAHQLLSERNIAINGATGSRLISGNHNLYPETESHIANFHQSESALLFNSGYDANVGFFSSVPQRNDIILYDELCHASIRDGLKLSNAKSYKFAHNDNEDLEKSIVRYQSNQIEIEISPPTTNNRQPTTYNHQPTTSNQQPRIYIITESVFSMDGDSPNLAKIAQIAASHECLLVVDEAHALGVFGKNGAGLVQELNLQDKVFARVMTFGKGLGCHGAAILGSQLLSDYLINFARSFIYTTGLPPHSLATIISAYRKLQIEKNEIEKLRDNILHFGQVKNQLGLKQLFVHGKSAIQSAIIPGNENVKHIAQQLQDNGFDVKAILSPTVAEGQERLRICLHSYNSTQEISNVLALLATFVFSKQ